MRLHSQTETDIEAETDEMASVPNGISVLVQSEYLHTIRNEPFLIDRGLF